MRITRGIPLPIVHTVQNAANILSPLEEDPFQSTAKRGALNLLGIGWTDGIHGIRIDNPTLEQIQVAVKLKPSPVKITPIESGEQHVPVPETTLVRQIVNG